MANYTETFESFGVASGLPSSMTSRWSTGSTFSTIDGGSGFIALRSATDNTHTLASLDSVNADSGRDNAEVLIRVRSSSVSGGTAFNGAVVRGSGAYAARNGYIGFFVGTDLYLYKTVSGTNTSLGSVATARFANQWWWIRLRANSTAIKVKAWLDGDAEPGSWGVEVTDSSVTGTGWAGYFDWENFGTRDCAELAVATSGDTASMSSAAVLSAPTAAATGNTAATIGVTSDTAPTTTAISYQILPAATAAPSAATIVGAPTGTITTGSAGALTKAITALTTDAAVKAHFAQGSTSNVVSSASFTPPTMASSGSLAAQTGTASTAFTWTGATPESQITVQGVGSSAWTLTSAGGSGLTTINSSTGVPGGTLTATPGSYTVTVTKTDSSTAGTNPTGGGAPPQTIVRTISLTVSAPVLRGFKFSSAAGVQLGTIVGSLTGLGLSTDGETWTAFAHDDTTRALVATSGTLTVAGGAGRLPDWSHASIGPGTYFVSLRRNSDGASCSARLASEVI